MITVNTRTHNQIISFKDWFGIKKRAYKIGAYLAVSYTGAKDNDQYQVYKVIDGKPIISGVFNNSCEAVVFAEWFDNIYGEYLCILSQYPDSNISELTQYTIPNGKYYCEAIQNINKHTNITLDIINGYIG